MTWTQVIMHSKIPRVGSYSETLRPAYNGLNYDPNQINVHVPNNSATLHTMNESIVVFLFINL